MSAEVYVRLREFMDSLPGGFPATPGGVEIRILQKLFSPAEAELLMRLGSEPEEVGKTALRIGMAEAELAAKLDEMASKGLVFRTRRDGKTLYNALQYLVGIYEFQLHRVDEELSRLHAEYSPHLGMQLMSPKTKQLRVVPVESSIPTEAVTSVEPYNRVRQIVEAQSAIAVAECICRKSRGLLGKECRRPRETCLSFGDFALFHIENGSGRKVTREETLEILKKAEEAGLVLCMTNSVEPSTVCCCCPCCCPILKAAKLLPQPAALIVSNYRATIDVGKCTGCGLCLDRCQIKAIELKEDRAAVGEGKCIGCGLCVTSCPVEALSMVEKPGVRPPPRDFLADTLPAISAERAMMRTKVSG